MIRILHVVSGLGSGGVESMLYNYYINIDKRIINFDFIVHDPNKGVLEDKFEKLGCKIHHVTPKKVSFIKNASEIHRIIKAGNYDIIHSHQNSVSFLSLFIAKINNIKIRIAHSHVGFINETPKAKIMEAPFKILTRYFATSWFACSNIASNWLFGKKKGKKDVYIINNAIDLKRFTFNENIRNQTRLDFGWEDKLILGNVSRFFPEKNHEFLLQIFKEIHKRNQKAVLVLIGGEGGEGREENIRELVKKLDLDGYVFFLGVRNDIEKILQAMDIFILPSKFEGLGMVLIEAQATNLTCFASDVIPKETNITELIQYISLEKSSEYWAERILSTCINYSRKKTNYSFKNSGFDINIESEKMEKIYLELFEKAIKSENKS